MAKSKPHEQRIIIAATVGKDGNIVIKLDFFPKMPTFEEYKKLPPEKQGVIAIINKFAGLNKEFIAQLTQTAQPEATQGPTPEQQAEAIAQREAPAANVG